jgi:hypothetical protein
MTGLKPIRSRFPLIAKASEFRCGCYYLTEEDAKIGHNLYSYYGTEYNSYGKNVGIVMYHANTYKLGGNERIGIVSNEDEARKLIKEHWFNTTSKTWNT